jgi:hypothetical protein
VTARIDRATAVGFGVVAVAAVLYWLAAKDFDAMRGDFFYLADAFLHGRTWLDARPGPNDVILIDGRSYVPFAPFPAVVLMPLVALIGPVQADQIESGVNAVLAAAGVGMCWWLLGRVGVASLVDRGWLVVLYGFSTQILWVTARGGVWHTGQLIASILTFAALIELWGRRRALLVGLLAGAAFLTRAPLAFAVPSYAALLDDSGVPRLHDLPWRRWIWLGLGVLPAVVAFFAYNQIRFGTPLESGYALATLPPFLEAQRAQGLFSLVHIPMNLDYFLVHPPVLQAEFPFIKGDGLGMSVFVTSPGMLFALRADWRRPQAWWLAVATILVLVPTLLYYGGGWWQYGYRYFLDSVPFVMALCGMAAVHRGGIGVGWRVLIVIGTVVMAAGVHFANNS